MFVGLLKVLSWVFPVSLTVCVPDVRVIVTKSSGSTKLIVNSRKSYRGAVIVQEQAVEPAGLRPRVMNCGSAVEARVFPQPCSSQFCPLFLNGHSHWYPVLQPEGKKALKLVLENINNPEGTIFTQSKIDLIGWNLCGKIINVVFCLILGQSYFTWSKMPFVI